MPRIAGVNIPENKKIERSLTHILGVGLSLSRQILDEVGIDPNKITSELTTEEVQRLKESIEKNHTVEGDLRRKVMLNIKRLKEIGSWRGCVIQKVYLLEDKELRPTAER